MKSIRCNMNYENCSLICQHISPKPLDDKHYNIQKCLDAEFKKIFIIALSDSIENEIRSSLKYQEEKIIIINLKKFLEDDYKVIS